MLMPQSSTCTSTTANLLNNYEVEWLATTISDLFGELCNSRHPDYLHLLTLVPHTTSNAKAPIPQRWRTEQILEGVVDDFALPSGDDSKSLRSDISGGENTTTSNRSYQSTTSLPTSLPLVETFKDENRLVNYGLDQPSSPQSIGSRHPVMAMGHTDEVETPTQKTRYSTETISNDISFEKITTNETTEYSMNSLIKESGTVKDMREMDALSMACPKNLTRPEPPPSPSKNAKLFKEMEKFGQNFYETAMRRLNLPTGLPLQMQRIQDISKSMNVTSSLEVEKVKIKSELKKYDLLFSTSFGFLPGREEKEPLRPLYMYYRRIKIAIARSLKKSEHNENEQKAKITEPKEIRPNFSATKNMSQHIRELSSLKLQEEKTALRIKLQQFQEDFVRLEGRPVRYHRDIICIENEYKQYKSIKDEIQKMDEFIKRKKAREQILRHCDSG